MAKKPVRARPSQGTIKTYRPGVVEGAKDATLGAVLRQIHMATGASEREASRRAGQVLRNIEELTGLEAAENSIRRIIGGTATGADYATVGVPLVPGVGGAAVRRAARRLDTASPPSITNRMYAERLGAPEYRPGDKLPRYGYRNVFGSGEIEDIARSGYMRAAPGKKGNKYFTMSDAEVPSSSNRGGNVLRVPSDRIPEGSPVRRRDVERWDEASSSWVPIKRKAKGGTVKAAKKKTTRGDGIAQRGNTRGKVR